MQIFDYVSPGTLTVLIVILAILIATVAFDALRTFVSQTLGWSLGVFFLLLAALIAVRIYQGESVSVAMKGTYDTVVKFDADLFVLIILALVFGGFGAWKWHR